MLLQFSKLRTDYNYIDRVPPEKFKTVLNKKIGEKKDVPTNKLKNLFGSKSLHHGCLWLWYNACKIRWSWMKTRTLKKRINHILQKLACMYQQTLHWLFIIQYKFKLKKINI